MKKRVALLILFGSFLTVNAQFLNWGIKGGMNYNANGDLIAISENIASDPFSSDEELGYHFGLLAEIKLPLFLYIRPELQYTHTESSYSDDGTKATFKMDKMEAPILLGFRFLGIGRFFLGPNFQYIIDNNLSATDNFEIISKGSSDDFSVAGQIGLGLNFGRFGADIRYETGFTDSQAAFLGEVVDGSDSIPALVSVDSDPQQFILSIYWKFNKKN
jgi:hypothetical protein